MKITMKIRRIQIIMNAKIKMNKLSKKLMLTIQPKNRRKNQLILPSKKSQKKIKIIVKITRLLVPHTMLDLLNDE